MGQKFTSLIFFAAWVYPTISPAQSFPWELPKATRNFEENFSTGRVKNPQLPPASEVEIGPVQAVYGCVSSADFAAAKSAADVLEAELMLLLGEDRATFGPGLFAFEIEYLHLDTIVMVREWRTERDGEGNDIAFHRATPGPVSEADRLILERAYLDKIQKTLRLVRFATEYGAEDPNWDRGLFVEDYSCVIRAIR